MPKQRLLKLFPFFLILYEFCTNMSNDMYLPALPSIANEFTVSIRLVQFTIAAWFAGDSALQLIMGPLSDRYGRRTVLFGGGILFLLSTIGCAFASTLSLLIVFRFLQGIGVCSMMVAGYASIHDLYDDHKAIHILTWMGSAAVIAPAIGPVFGGWILLITDWHAIFISLFTLGCFALIALYFCMPESASLEKHHTSMRFKTVFTSYRKLVCNASFIFSALSFALLYSGIIGWITVSPFILIETLGMTSTSFGYVQFFIFGAYVLGTRLVKRMLERIGIEPLIKLGLIITSAAAIALIATTFFAPQNALSFTLPLVVFALGFGICAAPLNRKTLTTTSEPKGVAIALFYLTMTGTGTAISILLSAVPFTPFRVSLIIAITILLSFPSNAMKK